MRTHYSVPENVALAQKGLAIFEDFAAYLDDAEADAGFTRCGLMIVAGDGPRAVALRETLAVARGLGLAADEISQDDARRIHPLLNLDDITAVGWEPRSGYADAYLTLTAFA